MSRDRSVERFPFSVYSIEIRQRRRLDISRRQSLQTSGRRLLNVSSCRHDQCPCRRSGNNVRRPPEHSDDRSSYHVDFNTSYSSTTFVASVTASLGRNTLNQYARSEEWKQRCDVTVTGRPCTRIGHIEQRAKSVRSLSAIYVRRRTHTHTHARAPIAPYKLTPHDRSDEGYCRWTLR